MEALVGVLHSSCFSMAPLGVPLRVGLSRFASSPSVSTVPASIPNATEFTMNTYEIQHKETGLCMFTAHTSNETEALNEYAGWRSGYDTFSEMARSLVFREVGACDVSATQLAR
jgi:hypothetical protein